MYHVSEDKRAIKSAQLIWEGLEKCLQEKELGKIRIADINQKCYVSRATFYRLFDNVQDVLMYECDLIKETELTDRELDYLISILSGMIPSVINVWYSHGQSESADELFRMVCTCISTIDAVLNA